MIIASLICLGRSSGFFEQTILYPNNGTGGSSFGSAVVLSSDGTRILVGALLDGTMGNYAGAVYVFEMNPTSDPSDWWKLRAVLHPNNGTDNGGFGSSLAFSSDGTRALVGAKGDGAVSVGVGAVYVFDAKPNNASDWTLQAVLYPRSGTGYPSFGDSMALSSNGSRAIIGAPHDNTLGPQVGAAYVFDVMNPNDDPTDWMEQAVLHPSNANATDRPDFGTSVAISSDGTRALIGAYGDDTMHDDAGAVHVYDVNPGNASDWMLRTMLFPSATLGLHFGISVALSSNGARALIGAHSEATLGSSAGAVYIFDANPKDDGNWTELAILYHPSNGTGWPQLGRSISLSSDGSRALVGAEGDDTVHNDAGAAYVFDANPSNSSDWRLQSRLYPRDGTGNPRFGRYAALSSDGTRGLVGAYGDNTTGAWAGAAYVFDTCPGGTILNNNGTECEPCPSDQVPNGNQTECILQEESNVDDNDDDGAASQSNWVSWFFF